MLHTLASGTLGHAVFNGRLGKAPFSDDIEEYFERSDVDGLRGSPFIIFVNFRNPPING